MNQKFDAKAVTPVRGLVINAPWVFEDPAFMAWLNNGSSKFTWHIKGNAVADEYSDVVVCVDPTLSGEGDASDMPEYIWKMIVETCREHIGEAKSSGENHYLVRLTNLQD